MDKILESLPIYMIIGIIVVVGISQFNRIAGSILGVVFWIAVAVVGTGAYDKGGGIKLLTFEFTLPQFYLFCGLFVAFNILNLVLALRRRHRHVLHRTSSMED